MSLRKSNELLKHEAKIEKINEDELKTFIFLPKVFLYTFVTQ